MPAITPPADLRKYCCKDPENLAVRPDPDSGRDELVHVCRVCGCRHFSVTIDALQVGVRET
jgi:hypothetical protein